MACPFCSFRQYQPRYRSREGIKARMGLISGLFGSGVVQPCAGFFRVLGTGRVSLTVQPWDGEGGTFGCSMDGLRTCTYRRFWESERLRNVLRDTRKEGRFLKMADT